jgi:hypothetical protein
MENHGIYTTAAAIFLVAITALFTFFFTSVFLAPKCQRMSHHYDLPSDRRVEYTEKFHDSQHTAIKAYVTQRCYVLANDQDMGSDGQRELRIIDNYMSEETLAAVYGQGIADFCRGMKAYPVETTTRQKRQDPFYGNACQDWTIVDCGSDQAVYNCQTGVNGWLDATVTCQEGNQFQLVMTDRCEQDYQEGRKTKCITEAALAYLKGLQANSVPQNLPSELQK